MAAHHINQTNSINHKSIWVDTINETDLCTAATPPPASPFPQSALIEWMERLTS